MDLRGGELRGRALPHACRVAFRAVGERPHAGILASVRCVVVAHERGELHVGRKHRGADGVDDLRPQAGALTLRHGVGKRRQRLGEGGLVRLLRGDASGLFDYLLQQELRRHQPVVHSLAHVGDGVVHLLREVAQALGVVVIVLGGGEGEERRQLRGVEVDAADLRDRHLPLFELDVFDVVAQVVGHEGLVHRFLLGEACGVDALEPQQELLRRRKVAPDRGLGVVGGLVVVASVAEDRGELGTGAEGVLPLVLQQIGERFAPLVEISRAQFTGGGGGGEEDDGEDEEKCFLHLPSLQPGRGLCVTQSQGCRRQVEV